MVMMSIVVSPETVVAITKEAWEQRRTKSALVRMILEEHFKAKEDADGKLEA